MPCVDDGHRRALRASDRPGGQLAWHGDWFGTADPTDCQLRCRDGPGHDEQHGRANEQRKPDHWDDAHAEASDERAHPTTASVAIPAENGRNEAPALRGRYPRMCCR
jgi:hypothetical protein